MGRKKKISFQLNPEWMLKEPIDFEYNKYTLLDYLQKCEKRFDNLEIYPDFVELSLHLANIQTLEKENKVFLTNKKFETFDDEILLRDLLPKETKHLSEQEEEELGKTLKYSGIKLLDAFNIAKSIWTLAFQNIDVYIKKNVENLSKGYGYSYFFDKSTNKIHIWEFYRKKIKDDKFDKMIFKEIYFGEIEDMKLMDLIEQFSSFNKTKFFKQIPIFETITSYSFPLEQTLIPLMKRKINSYYNQSIQTKKIGKFDIEI